MSVALRNFSFPAADERWPTLPALLVYPGDAPEKPVRLGPFTTSLAMGAPLPDRVRGLIVISHGTGGSQLVHLETARRLATAGYLVAALEHGGDNYRESGLLSEPDYFLARPRQLRALIAALRAHPDWQALLADKPVGAIGHSAGGGTVLTLAGARPDLVRLVRYYRSLGEAERADTAAGSKILPRQSAILAQHSLSGLKSYLIDEAEPLLSAVVAMAPVGVLFDPASLVQISMPLKVYIAEHDTILPQRVHGMYLEQHLRPGTVELVPDAGHFAFMTQSPVPLPSLAGDAAANPPGFDRRAWLDRMDAELTGFFEQAWAGS